MWREMRRTLCAERVLDVWRLIDMAIRFGICAAVPRELLRVPEVYIGATTRWVTTYDTGEYIGIRL